MVETSTEYRERIAREKLLLESPAIVRSDTPEAIKASTKTLIDFVKHNHQYKFSVIDTSIKNPYEINVSNIEANKHKIWGENVDRFAHITLQAKK